MYLVYRCSYSRQDADQISITHGSQASNEAFIKQGIRGGGNLTAIASDLTIDGLTVLHVIQSVHFPDETLSISDNLSIFFRTDAPCMQTRRKSKLPHSAVVQRPPERSEDCRGRGASSPILRPRISTRTRQQTDDIFRSSNSR